MQTFLITWHESDGNDCRVYDSIITAATEDDALSQLGDALESRMEHNGASYEADGNHLGYYFGCSEDCSEDCEGHGGTSLREVQAFETEEGARNAMSRWHSEWSI